MLRRICAFLLAWPAVALALPAAGPLRFVAPTPAPGTPVTSGTVVIRLDAACTFDPATLAVSVAGVAVPAGPFLPFSACTDGRITSQAVPIAVALPDGAITGGPTTVTAGTNGTFTGSGNGDGLAWNFDGGAAPATGGGVSATFAAAGTFTVRMRATRGQPLAASGLNGAGLVTAQRQIVLADPTPASRQVVVTMPADVDFANFEASQVHPLALSVSGTQLYAVNTPDGRLAIFTVAGDGSLAFTGDVPVGVDPVSLAVRPGSSEVWVANHLSDSVSIVDTATRTVVATLAVGDEPTDVVFASGRAFVALAGSEDRVKVFDAATRAQVASVALFGDDARALAANAAGTEVYAVVLRSGNRTTVVPEPIVTAGGGPPPPVPPRTPALGTAPEVALIVKFNSANGRWEDETGHNWTSAVTYTLPDQDVFVIDADAATPTVLRTASGVGTSLFDVAVHPVTGQLWVPNTEARNHVRFEPNLRGHPVDTRVSLVNPTTGAVSTVPLNPHVNYGAPTGPPGEVALSLSTPGDGVFTADGSRYYLTALGSAKVAVLNAAGVVTARIAVGGGPSGVALAEGVGRLYVLNRFDDTISIVDTTALAQVGTIGVAGAAAFDPSPDAIKVGRRFLYDGTLSGHGDVSCATCHLSGDLDALGWDLGHPQGAFVPYSAAPWISVGVVPLDNAGFDPMKGPMTTQTLRGLAGIEPFHWRGDRRDFQHFNQAFVGLLGRAAELPTAEMDAFAAFAMTLRHPPNPFRNADDSVPPTITIPSKAGGGATATGNPTAGASVFSGTAVDGPFTCNTCHTLPTGTSTDLIGTGGFESQDLKIPQLRNMYEKVDFAPIRLGIVGGNPANIGLSAQKAGFGFLHDGLISLTEFMAIPQFTMNDTQERDVTAFMMVFPTGTAPAVGRQVTVTVANKTSAPVVSLVTTLVAQANASRCDLIVKGVVGGTTKGWAYDRTVGAFVPDALLDPTVAESALRGALTGADVVSYTAVPLGSGVRLGIDRDRDTWRDRTETVLGTDPADPRSNPWATNF